MAQIAVIDDKEILRDSIAEALTREDHKAVTFADPVEALAAVRAGGFDLILTDLKMPRMDGVSLIREARGVGIDIPIVMMTAYATVATAVEAMKLGAVDYIQKPFELDALTVLIDRALEHDRLRRENAALRVSVSDMQRQRALIGSGRAMTELRKQLDRIAQSHDTVLITGESGVGKELVASQIHRSSPRAQDPMMCLNCAALSASLLESELFGHERGAFTGADRLRKGRFELAHGGTLLLDEISEMAVGLQAKLLRVLQEGEFERVGSSTTQRANVRVIATTNRDLREWVEKKRFREDLFYRLNVLPVRVPPLRERVEDVVELATHFLSQARMGSDAPELHISDEAAAVLTGYDWPGNIRELENLCRRAATLCTGDMIHAQLIEPWIRGERRSGDGVDMNHFRDGRMLEDMERFLIERTLARFNGHRAKSAKALGMGVRTLGLKLKQWRDEEAARAAREAETMAMAGTGGNGNGVR